MQNGVFSTYCMADFFQCMFLVSSARCNAGTQSTWHQEGSLNFSLEQICCSCLWLIGRKEKVKEIGKVLLALTEGWKEAKKEKVYICSSRLRQIMGIYSDQ